MKKHLLAAALAFLFAASTPSAFSADASPPQKNGSEKVLSCPSGNIALSDNSIYSCGPFVVREAKLRRAVSKRGGTLQITYLEDDGNTRALVEWPDQITVVINRKLNGTYVTFKKSALSETDVKILVRNEEIKAKWEEAIYVQRAKDGFVAKDVIPE